MIGFEITCFNKNAQGIVTRIGGSGWTMDIRQTIVRLLSLEIQLNIRVDNQYHMVGVRGSGFDAYLVIEPDGFPLHELVDLPSC